MSEEQLRVVFYSLNSEYTWVPVAVFLVGLALFDACRRLMKKWEDEFGARWSAKILVSYSVIFWTVYLIIVDVVKKALF